MHSTRRLHPYAYVCVCTCTFMRCIKFMERYVFQYVARLYFFILFFFVKLGVNSIHGYFINQSARSNIST